eukprot:5261340-Prymnesium_polylepis.1
MTPMSSAAVVASQKAGVRANGGPSRLSSASIWSRSAARSCAPSRSFAEVVRRPRADGALLLCAAARRGSVRSGAAC